MSIFIEKFLHKKLKKHIICSNFEKIVEKGRIYAWVNAKINSENYSRIDKGRGKREKVINRLKGKKG